MATETAVVRKCQVYKSALKSHKIIAPRGKVLHVVDYKHITDNEDDIAFLDEEIRKGFPYLKKLTEVEVRDADPMAALREQIKKEAIAEYLAKEQAELAAAGEENKVVDTGESKSDAPKVTLNPASSAKLAGLAGKSNS